MGGIVTRASSLGRFPGRLRSRLVQREVCPGCLNMGSMRQTTDEEDWAMLGESTVLRRFCTVCGTSIIERERKYPTITAADSNRSRIDRVFRP